MTPLYCTIRQAIELTGTNKKRLNEWIKDGLPIYRPPGKTAPESPVVTFEGMERATVHLALVLLIGYM